MYSTTNTQCMQHGRHRTAIVCHRHGLLPTQQHKSRFVAARMYRKVNDQLAERTKEVWDDEEDIQAAVDRLGLNKEQQGGDSGPLLSEVNRLYVEKNFPKGYVGQLELRYMQGKGYGLVASQPIPKGQLLAICPPLAWVSGLPGQPPRLEELIRHINNSHFNKLQRNALLSLASLPALDEAHEQAQQQRQQQQRQDRLLRAAQELEAAAPGAAVSSLPISKSAMLKKKQRQLRAEREWDLGEDDLDEEEEDEGIEQSLGGFGSSSSSSSSSSRGLRRLGSINQERRVPDLLELLECTDTAAGDGSSGRNDAAAAKGRWGGSSSSRGAGVAGAAGAAGDSGQRLAVPPDRLTALVCRNALAEMCQDLPASSSRGDRPGSATGIWPLLTAFNHSCAPNAVAVLVGGLPAAPVQQQQLLQAQQQQQGPVTSAAAARGTGVQSKGSSAAQPGVVNPWAKANPKQRGKEVPKTPAAGSTAASSSSGSSSSSGGSSSSSGSSSSGSSSGRMPSKGGLLGLSSEPGVGPFVLVRAATELAAGDEVTLDYLAPGVEGSLVHRERRAAVLAQRWGFTCRCERCSAEQQLGVAVQRSQLAANSLAARLGPAVSAALAAGDTDSLAAASTALSGAVQQLERQVNSPTIAPRVAAWAHASIYQAHALLAITKMSLAPKALKSLAAIGTAMELAGFAGPGCAVHLLGSAALLTAAHDTWGAEDARAEATIRGLLEALQLRYGPLEAGVTQQLAAATQQWAEQLEGARLGLVAPAAAAAARARLALAAAATADSSATAQRAAEKVAAAEAGTGAAAAARSSSSSSNRTDEVQEEEEEDVLAEMLELEADEVLEVTEELLEEMYGEDGDRDTAGASSVSQQQQQQQHVRDDDVLVKQRSEAEVLEELQMFAGFAEGLPQQQQLLQHQMSMQQQQMADQAAEDGEEELQQQQQQVDPQIVGSTAAAAGESEGGDQIAAVAPELPMLATWLQGGPGQEEQQLADPQQPLVPQQPPPRAGVAAVRPGRQAGVRRQAAVRPQAGARTGPQAAGPQAAGPQAAARPGSQTVRSQAAGPQAAVTPAAADAAKPAAAAAPAAAGRKKIAGSSGRLAGRSVKSLFAPGEKASGGSNQQKVPQPQPQPKEQQQPTKQQKQQPPKQQHQQE